MVEIIPFDEVEYLTALSTLRPSDTRCVVEHVGSMPGNGGKAMFTFGENFGLIQGYLRARGIPFQLVRPQKWKKEFTHDLQGEWPFVSPSFYGRFAMSLPHFLLTSGLFHVSF